MRKALVIARRELASMFGGPLAWVLGAVFAVLTGYFFYSDLTFYVLFGGANLASGLWRYVFLDFRMVAMLVVPLITMRLLAEERKLGTLELLWTFPVRDREVVAGKFLAALAAYTLMLLPDAGGPGGALRHASVRARAAARGLHRHAAARRGVHRVRAGGVGGDRQPGRQRAAHLRRARPVVVPRLERGRAQRARWRRWWWRCRSSTASTASRRAPSTAATSRTSLAFIAALPLPGAARAGGAHLARRLVTRRSPCSWRRPWPSSRSWRACSSSPDATRCASISLPSAASRCHRTRDRSSAALRAEVRATAFTSNQEQAIRQQIADLLHLYRDAQPLITTRMLDLDRSPGEAERLAVEQLQRRGPRVGRAARARSIR